MPSDIFSNILQYFTESELRGIALVCKNWCHETALVINANSSESRQVDNDLVVNNSEDGMNESTSIEDGIDLTEETSSNLQAIRVVPNSFLKSNDEKDVIDLSTEADVIDLCAGMFLILFLEVIVSHNIPRFLDGGDGKLSKGGNAWQTISSKRFTDPLRGFIVEGKLCCEFDSTFHLFCKARFL